MFLFFVIQKSSIFRRISFYLKRDAAIFFMTDLIRFQIYFIHYRNKKKHESDLFDITMSSSPYRMKNSISVCTGVRVCAKVISLCLSEVSRRVFSSVGIIVSKRGGESRTADAASNAGKEGRR